MTSFRGRLIDWDASIAMAGTNQTTVLALDTDHITALGYGTPAGLRLRDRLLDSSEEISTTIITVEEQ
jgi:hypothetical protein